MMYTLYLPSVGEYLTSSTISLTFSTPLFDAASISITFMEVPAAIPLHKLHSLQGLPSLGFSQFTVFANNFATEVLPVPLVPVNR